MLILTLQRSTNARPNHVKMAAAAPTRLPATVACVLRDTPEITVRLVSNIECNSFLQGAFRGLLVVLKQ